MVRAAGSYPAGRWFESDRRYQSFGMSHHNSVAYAEIWPLGQVVKTSPFHGGIMGSNPVGVTTIKQSTQLCWLFFCVF